MQKFSILLCSLLLAASAWAGSKADPGKQAIVLEEFVFMKSPTRDCHASSIMACGHSARFILLRKQERRL